jgi:hypothetical protein
MPIRPRLSPQPEREYPSWLRRYFERCEPAACEGFEIFSMREPEFRAAWLALGPSILRAWIMKAPGTRPEGWWRYAAPRWPRADWPARLADLGPWADDLFPAPRKRLAGVGDAVFEHLNYLPEFRAGVPAQFVDAWSVAYYTGAAVSADGSPIGQEYVGHRFMGLAIDPNDPPAYESSAAYLLRHGLLTPAEVKRLTVADFAPIRVVEDGGGR